MARGWLSAYGSPGDLGFALFVPLMIGWFVAVFTTFALVTRPLTACDCALDISAFIYLSAFGALVTDLLIVRWWKRRSGLGQRAAA